MNAITSYIEQVGRGGSVRGAEAQELAEIKAALNRINSYTKEAADVVNAFTEIAQTLKPWQRHELITSAWEVKYLLTKSFK